MVVGETEHFMKEEVIMECCVLVHLTYYHDSGFNIPADVFIFHDETNVWLVYTRMASNHNTAHSSVHHIQHLYFLVTDSYFLSFLSSAPHQPYITVSVHNYHARWTVRSIVKVYVLYFTMPRLLLSETCMKIRSLVSYWNKVTTLQVSESVMCKSAK